MGQPACLEENFVTNFKSSIEMAPRGSHPCRFPHRNFLPLDPVEDELAREPGPIEGPHSGSTFPALSHNPTPGPKLVPALNFAPVPAPVLAPVPAPALPSPDELFKQFMRAYLQLNQGLRQISAEFERSFKAKIPEVYYGKSHMDCYHFCQHCKDHFETAGATGNNRTLFAASFLCGNISVR